MSQVFPMVSNSPPPLDDDTLDDCDNDFGHFTGADSSIDLSTQSDSVPSNSQHFEDSEDFSDKGKSHEKNNEAIKIEQFIFKPVLQTLDLHTSSDLENGTVIPSLKSESSSPVNVDLVIDNVDYDNATDSFEKRSSQADSGLCSSDVSPGPRSEEMSESYDKSNTLSTDGEETFADFSTEDSGNSVTVTTDSRQQCDSCDQNGQNDNCVHGVEHRTEDISKSETSVCDKVNAEKILTVEDESSTEEEWADFSFADGDSEVVHHGSPTVNEILENEQMSERFEEKDKLPGSPDTMVSISESVSSDEKSHTDKSESVSNDEKSRTDKSESVSSDEKSCIDKSESVSSDEKSRTDKLEFSSHADATSHEQFNINTCNLVNIPDSENSKSYAQSCINNCKTDSHSDQSDMDDDRLFSEHSDPQVSQNSHSSDDLHLSHPNANGAWSDENISDIPIYKDIASQSETGSHVTYNETSCLEKSTNDETEPSSTSDEQSVGSHTSFNSGQGVENVDQISEHGSEDDFTDFSSAPLPSASDNSGNFYVESTQIASEFIEDIHIANDVDLSKTQVGLVSGGENEKSSESEDSPDGNDEEFGRRRLYSEDLQLDLPKATCDLGEDEEETNWAAFTKTSGLPTSKTDEEAKEKNCFGEITSSSQLVAPSASDANIDDDDWAEFDDCNEVKTSTFKHMPSPTGSSIQDQNLHSSSVSSKIETLLLTCFQCAKSCTSDHNRQMLDKYIDTAQQSILPKLTLTQILPRDRKQIELWGRLKDLDNTRAFDYQWPESRSNNNMYRTLKIDVRNILMGHKKQQIPVYATHLTLLEPTKGPVHATREMPLLDTLNVDSSSNKQMPEVKFDWGGSGLTNPLEALQSEFLDGDSTPAKSNIQPLENILANLKTTVVKKPTKDENLSEETAKIIDYLPNLLFMQAKVLMFPINQSECN